LRQASWGQTTDQENTVTKLTALLAALACATGAMAADLPLHQDCPRGLVKKADRCKPESGRPDLRARPHSKLHSAKTTPPDATQAERQIAGDRLSTQKAR
jgi:hypothetical protein